MALRAARRLARRGAAPLSTIAPRLQHARRHGKIKLGPKPVKRKPARGDWQGLKDLRARLAAEGSLVDDTLHDMTRQGLPAARSCGRRASARRSRRSKDEESCHLRARIHGAFVQQAGCDGTRRDGGFAVKHRLYCNRACNHCHAESSPRRTRPCQRGCGMFRYSQPLSVTTLDITGGAPEYNRVPEDRTKMSGVETGRRHHRSVQSDRARGAGPGGPCGFSSRSCGARRRFITLLFR